MDRASRRELEALLAHGSLGNGLLIASNRGPNEYELRDGHWQVRPGAGGLVSLLEPIYRNAGVTWLACAMSDAEREFVRESGLGTIVADQASNVARMRYVLASREDFRDYYATFSNELLWPLQHGMWGAGDRHRIERRHHDAWRAYVRVNEAFACELAEAGGESPAVLVQDYHLYLVPRFLRRLRPGARILHFTHIPWPSLRGWQALPDEFVRAIFDSLVCADVLGFQTAGDVRYFLTGAELLYGVEAVDHTAGVVTVGGRRTLVRDYPAAPDVQALRAGTREQDLASLMGRVAPRLGEKTIVRVDRLDPSKNQLLGFEAFRELLREEPERRRDTHFLACLIPSRTDISMYREYRDAVFRIAGEINAEFEEETGPQEAITILYMNDRKQALAAMREADVLLANSVADGMNLVVKEALVVSSRGIVPVVGQGAGVCEELRPWVLPVAASDVWGTSRALSRALAMTPEERLANQAAAVEYLKRRDLGAWITGQLRDLEAVSPPE